MEKEIDFYALGERYQKESYIKVLTIADTIEDRYGAEARERFEEGFESNRYSFSNENDFRKLPSERDESDSKDFGFNYNEAAEMDALNQENNHYTSDEEKRRNF